MRSGGGNISFILTNINRLQANKTLDQRPQFQHTNQGAVAIRCFTLLLIKAFSTLEMEAVLVHTVKQEERTTLSSMSWSWMTSSQNKKRKKQSSFQKSVYKEKVFVPCPQTKVQRKCDLTCAFWSLDSSPSPSSTHPLPTTTTSQGGLGSVGLSATVREQLREKDKMDYI